MISRLFAVLLVLLLCATVLIVRGRFLDEVFGTARPPNFYQPDYAHAVFDGVLAFDDILSSQYTNGKVVPKCSHVFVRLTENPPLDPPAPRALTDRLFRFGGIWRPTPMLLQSSFGDDPLTQCWAALPSDIVAEIKDAFLTPGAFYARDLTDGTYHLYASTRRLAGRIRTDRFRR